MRALKVVAAGVAAIVLAGCAGIQPDPGADAVRLTSNLDLVKSCSFVKQETVDITSLEAYGPDLLKDGAIIKIKNAAAASGANTVVTAGPQSHGAGTGAMMMTGDLYRCP